MKLIVAVDKNWAIGYQNQLLISIPADKKFFRETTTGKAVIMGRNTLLSFPNSRPLKDRKNIILSRSGKNLLPSDTYATGMCDAVVVNSIEAAVAAAKDYAEEDIFVIGGASIYKQMLQYCDTAYVTKIEYEYQADAFFPNLDEDEEWELVEESEESTYYDIEWRFTTYKRRK